MAFQIVVEHQVLAENARILCIETENQPHAQRIQAFQRFRVIRILILRQQCIIQNANQLARFEGNLHFLLDMFAGRINKELQPMIFLLQIAQLDNFRRIIGAVHIMNVKLIKIADNNPARLL